MSKNRGVEIKRNQVEHSHPNRRFVKLRTPFSVIKNAFSDTRVMHDFNYEIPAETKEEFWKKNVKATQPRQHTKFMKTNKTKI